MTNTRLTTSATQIDQWLMCKRRWVAGYLLGLKQSQTEAMAFGEAGHKYLEIYNRTGVVPDETKPWQFTKESRIRYPGLSAKKALKHIPSPHTGRPEHGFKFAVHGIEFIGYIDLEWLDATGLWITDYKFVSSFQSALAEDSLAANVQATIYATKAMLEHKVKEVNLKWIYILSTKNPSAKSVISRLDEVQTKTQLKVLLDICEETIELKENIKLKHGINIKQLSDDEKNNILNSIEPTVESCSRYDGCYYCNRCQLTEEQLIEGDMKDMDKDLENKLKNMGLDRFIKAPSTAQTTQKKAEKQTSEQVKKQPTTTTVSTTSPSKQLEIDAFLKTPVVHKSEGRKETPKVQLNAPENYLEQITEKQLQKEVKATVVLAQEPKEQTSCLCSGQIRLSTEEKETLKTLLCKLVDAS